jgi:predicted transcriptional regulator
MMDWSTVMGVGAPLVGLAASVVAQVVAHILFSRKPIVFSYAVGFLCGAVVSLLTLSASGQADGWADGLVCLLTFGGLNYCYSNFVNLNFTSLRIRLLKELLSAGGGESIAEIARKYGSEAILQRRLERLVTWGQLRRENERFTATGGSFLRLALLFTVLKKIVLGRGFRYETAA